MLWLGFSIAEDETQRHQCRREEVHLVNEQQSGKETVERPTSASSPTGIGQELTRVNVGVLGPIYKKALLRDWRASMTTAQSTRGRARNARRLPPEAKCPSLHICGCRDRCKLPQGRGSGGLSCIRV